MNFDVYTFSSRGGRDHNEDSAGHRIEGGSGLFAVADGLGGHAHGELASACAVDTFLEGWSPGSSDRAAWLRSVLEEANRRVIALQKEQSSILMSTAAVLAIDDVWAVWAHVGDSRIYHIHNGWLKSVTADHSVAYKKYKAGEITREGIAWDDDQSRLLRTLGSEDRHEPEISFYNEALTEGDAFLLCSDGAWEYLRDGEIPIDLAKSLNAKQWVEWLVLRMMDRFAFENDNFTLMAVMLL